MPKRRRGSKKVVRAKEKMRSILKEETDILEKPSDEWPNWMHVYKWLSQHHPEITETLSPQEIQGVYGELKKRKIAEEREARAETLEGEGEPEGSEQGSGTLSEPSEEPHREIPEGSETLEKAKGETLEGSETLEKTPRTLSPPSIGPIHAIPSGGPPSPALRPGEAIIEVEGVPVGTKIRLTPKSLLLFDWFKAKYGYEGDISDFINDAIEDFFRARGYKVLIVKEEEGVKGVV